MNWETYDKYESKTNSTARKFSGVRIDFWGVKFLWRRDRHYVATPNMEVWQRLACLAPDAPDGWSFPDDRSLMESDEVHRNPIGLMLTNII